jgi:hypothetical protein
MTEIRVLSDFYHFYIFDSYAFLLGRLIIKYSVQKNRESTSKLIHSHKKLTTSCL